MPIRYPLACVLSLASKRHKREGEGENDREPDPPHEHPVGMAGGSLAGGSLADLNWLGGAAEHCAQDVVSLAAPPRDERVDLLGLLGRHGGVLVADIGEVAQGNP